jgi:ATP-dependent Clp protease ATP-binding subunit ClpC
MAEPWFQRKGPRRVFFFCGPTGTGKTETAKILSKILGGDREAMIRIDCNTLQGSASEDAGPVINRLLGVPPGYIGYARGEGGLLSRIRDTPECVVLFDEIEKASSAISKILLQVLDEGRVEDSDSNLLDFRRAFIVFTTNAGCSYETKGKIGFGKRTNVAGEASPTVSVEAVKDELLARGYGMEFFGRPIDFIVFHGMRREDVKTILERELARLDRTAVLRGYELEVGPAVVDHLLDEWTPRFGARWALEILQKRILEQLDLAAAQGELAAQGKQGEKGWQQEVKRIRIVKRPADDLPTGEASIAGLAARERSPDGLTMTILVH